MKSFYCPYCDHKMTEVSPVESKKDIPGEGDYTLCINCAGICTIHFKGEQVTLRKVDTGQLLILLKEHPETMLLLMQAVNGIRFVNNIHIRRN